MDKPDYYRKTKSILEKVYAQAREAIEHNVPAEFYQQHALQLLTESHGYALMAASQKQRELEKANETLTP